MYESEFDSIEERKKKNMKHRLKLEKLEGKGKKKKKKTDKIRSQHAR